MTNAQAQTYYDDSGIDSLYNNYEPSQYSLYEPNYNTKHQSYNNNYKSQDSSVSKCINTNLNINGNNTGDVNIGNKGQGYLGANSYGDGYYDDGYNNNGFECIIDNNNNNTNVVAGGRDGDNGEDDQGITLQTCPEDTLLVCTNVTSLTLCNLVDEDLKECQICAVLASQVLDFKSEYLSLLDEFNAFVNPANGERGLVGICTSSDVTSAFNAATEAAEIGGTTEIDTRFASCVEAASGRGTDNNAGGIVPCDTNTGDVASSFSQPTISQGIEDSSALAKIEKLKQQWLDLLP
jgi:hypothetical protein